MVNKYLKMKEVELREVYDNRFGVGKNLEFTRDYLIFDLLLSDLSNCFVKSQGLIFKIDVNQLKLS